jgi:apolipoprotein N-acyltransferase
MAGTILLLLCSSGLNWVSFLTWGSFNGFALGGWLTAIPFLFVLRHSDWRRGIVIGAGWGVLTYAVLLWWMAGVSWAGYALFVAVLSLQGVISGSLIGIIFSRIKSPLLRLICVPSAWVCSEYARTLICGGFSWGLGFSQALIPEFVQLARLGGSYAVSWVMVFFGMAVILRFERKGRAFFRDPVSLTLLGFPLLVWLGGALVMAGDPYPASTPLRVVLVQPNITHAQKSDISLYNVNAARHLELSKKGTARARPDLIVWPETAFTDDIMRDPYWRPRMELVARNFNAFMLFGSALLSDDGKDLNAVILLDPAGVWKDVYYKHHLVPFTEFLPDDPLSRLIARSSGMRPYHFLSGTRAGILNLEKLKVAAGVAVCSEEAYPDLFRSLARQGAGILVTVLNDGWFTSTQALMLHARMAVFRAVETARPLLRSANTGWSAGVDARGRVLGSAALQAPAWVLVKAFPGTGQTWYMQFGDLFVGCCAGFVIITLMAAIMKSHMMIPAVFAGVMLVSFDAQAAAVAQRRAQMMQQAQQQAQEQMVQQAQAQQMAAQQQAQVAAYQQAAAVQQAQVRQMAAQKAAAEYAAYKQAMEMAVARKNAELQAAAQLQQMVAQKQAAVAHQTQMQQVAEYQAAAAYKQAQEVQAFKQIQSQAQLNGEIRQYAEYMAKRRAVMQAQQVQVEQAITERQLLEHAAYQKSAEMKKRVELNAAYKEDVMRRKFGQQAASEVMAENLPGYKRDALADLPETTVDIKELWSALDRSALSWPRIMDAEIKLLTVSEYIDRFRKAGIIVRRPPGEYVKMIDSLSHDNEDILKAGFANVLSYAAIVEYDFQNGKNRDDLARSVLGEAAFEANKRRISAGNR